MAVEHAQRLVLATPVRSMVSALKGILLRSLSIQEHIVDGTLTAVSEGEVLRSGVLHSLRNLD